MERPVGEDRTELCLAATVLVAVSFTERRPDSRRAQIIRAAWLYYERGFNQQAVAERLEVSRSTVSRLLSDAERLGIVRVIVTEPPPESVELAEALVSRFGLVAATVEPTLEGDAPRNVAATAMARRVEHMVTGSSRTIATGWGRTLGAAAQRIRVTHTSGVTIVDAFGHTTTTHIANSVEVSNTLAGRIGAEVVHIPAPGFAPSAEVAKAFYESEAVSTTLDLARTADAVMVAIGVVGADSLLIDANYIEPAVMDEMIEAGAIGEVFGRYFDIEGNEVMPGALHPISLSLDDLRASKRVITAAGGAAKAQAMRGALATGAVDEVAVDDTLARAMLADA